MAFALWVFGFFAVGSLVIGGVVIAGAVYFTHKALKSDDYLTLLSYISSLQLSCVAIILPFMPMEVDYLPAAFIGTVMMAMLTVCPRLVCMWQLAGLRKIACL